MSEQPLTAAESADFSLFAALMQDFTLRERWPWDRVAKMARLWLANYELIMARERGPKPRWPTPEPQPPANKSPC